MKILKYTASFSSKVNKRAGRSVFWGTYRRKHLHGRDFRCKRNLFLDEVGHPETLPQLSSELLIERPNVRDEGRGEQHVANEGARLLFEVEDTGSPAARRRHVNSQDLVSTKYQT